MNGNLATLSNFPNILKYRYRYHTGTVLCKMFYELKSDKNFNAYRYCDEYRHLQSTLNNNGRFAGALHYTRAKIE
jgi:hypothetical protein